MRTLDDIIPPSRRAASEATSAPAGSKSSRPRSRFPFTTIIIAGIIIVAAIGGLFYFSGAKVEVTPTTVSTAVQSSFTATQGSGDLPFVVVSVQKVATQSVTGSGTKLVNTNASGTITVYNTQSKTQKLIANTRFATTAGLVFRIHSALSIPAGTVSKPGSVQVTVYANQPGATYNVGSTSFTLPGFAGTAQASEVYAQSSAPMTGGASGQVPIITPAIDSATQSALTTALAPELTAALETQVPEGYVILTGAATTTYQELTPELSATTGKVDVKEQGTISAVAFPNAALAKAISASVPGLGYNGEPVTLSSTDGLAIALPGIPDASKPTVSFTLSGTAALVYTVNPTRIASAVAGKTRSAAEVALSNYPEVKRAVLVLRPFWRGSFPEDPASITVVVDQP